MPKNDSHYVVGIGASAGGLDAIHRLFDNLPKDTGMSFVIIQHLSPDFKSLMPELLSKHTSMPIYTAEDKQEVKPNCIYLNQKNKNLHIKGNKLYLLDKGPRRNLNLPIDIFFHTLGEEYQNKAIGIILSGTGSDGSRGIKTIKEAGGSILVQEPNSAQFDGMPNSAIATNLVDFIFTPSEISKWLAKQPLHPVSLMDLSEENNPTFASFNKLLLEVKKKTGIDFRLYKRNTLQRRIEKRMQIHDLNTLPEYLTFVEENEKEIEILGQGFLIGVTSFFRDREAFEAFQLKVLPEIVKNKVENEPIRIWAAGCSSGEEVYSIAILLDNYLKTHKYRHDFKIFATDVDNRAIDAAGTGKYPFNTSTEVDPEFLHSYFIKSSNSIQIIKRIRDKIVFSKHNLLKDPPFIRLDLVTCRNLLIYLNNEAQRKAFINFQFALNKNGYLFLGNSESLGDLSKYFKTIDTKWKIFQSISDTKYISPRYNPEDKITTLNFNNIPRGTSAHTTTYQYKSDPEALFHSYLSKTFSPSSIFIDRDYNIIFINRDAGKRLNHSEGMFQNNLLKMVNPDIAAMIRNGINRLSGDNKVVVIKDIINKAGGKAQTFDLTFHDLSEHDGLDRFYLIQFGEDKIDVDETVILSQQPMDDRNKQRIEDLESELKRVRTELQNVVEELETSNEELQSSNEELMASNEELQSTNEELQSVNEELYTVNTELQEKNKELKILNDDVTNLLESTDIGTLFLDTNLHIRKFTPALTQHFKLHEADLGRPISSFTSYFDEETRTDFISDAKISLKKLTTIEREVVNLDGNFFLRRIGPFITSNKQIDGVVVSFVDIGKIKELEEQRVLSDTRYKNLFDHMNEGFSHAKIITNKKGKPIDWEYITVNKAFEKQTGLKAADVIGNRISEILPDIQNDPANWIEKYGHTALTGEEQYIEDYSKPLGKFYVVHVFSPQKGEFAATFADLSEMKAVEENLVAANERLNLAAQIAEIGIWEYDIKNQSATGDDYWSKIFGFTEPDVMKQWVDRMHKDDAQIIQQKFQDYIEGKMGDYQAEFRYFHPTTNQKMWIKNSGKIVEWDEGGNPTKILGASHDVSNYKRTLENLKKEQNFISHLNEVVPCGVYIYDLKENINTFINKTYTDILGYTHDEINAFGDKFMELFHPEDREAVMEHMGNVVSRQAHEKIEYRFKHKNGEYVWCFSVDSPFEVDEKDNVLSFIGAFITIDEKKKLEGELIEAKNKAEKASKHKNLFLANMSHEIRSPMNAVIGFSNLLKDQDLTKDTKDKYLNIIDSSSNQLLNLLDDIIDIAKIEVGELSFKEEDVDLNDLMVNTYQIYLRLLEVNMKNALSLELDIPTQKIRLRIDSKRFKQVIANLLNNAIKFSEGGKIRFGYRKKEDMLEFFVSDQGIGIAQEKLEEIFESFKQVSYTPSKYGGTGLGLAICKGIVNIMNGQINVESVANRGSTFRFTLPIIEPNEQSPSLETKHLSDDEINWSKKTVLLVEDSKNVQYFYSELLRPTGLNLLIAADGAEGVELFKAIPNIDAVLLDIRMPKMNGFEVLEEMLKINKKSKVIIQTAYAMTPDDKEKCLKLGCKAYINKPINKEELFTELGRQLKG